MAEAATSNKIARLAEGILEGEKPPLIEPGVYDLGFIHHRTAYLFGRAPKLILHFRVVQCGAGNGVILCRYYNVKTLNSKPRKGGSFKVGWRCDFVREYVTLFGMPARLDRISTETFKTQIVRGRVTTVERDNKGRPIPEGLRYSVISELLESVK